MKSSRIRFVGSGRSMVGVCASRARLRYGPSAAGCVPAHGPFDVADGVCCPNINSTGVVMERSSASVSRRGTKPAGRKSRKTLRSTAKSSSGGRPPFPRKRARRLRARSDPQYRTWDHLEEKPGTWAHYEAGWLDRGDAAESGRGPHRLVQCDAGAVGEPDARARSIPSPSSSSSNQTASSSRVRTGRSRTLRPASPTASTANTGCAAPSAATLGNHDTDVIKAPARSTTGDPVAAPHALTRVIPNDVRTATAEGVSGHELSARS